jgi:hypothetical protein
MTCLELFRSELCGGLIKETEWAKECREANRLKREQRRSAEPSMNLCPPPMPCWYGRLNNEDGLDWVMPLIEAWPNPEPIKNYLEWMPEEERAEKRQIIGRFWLARERSGALKKEKS